jgi:hypothetical protein
MRTIKKPIAVKVYQYNVCKFECSSEHDAFMYLLRSQPRSVLYAIMEDGWNVEVDYGQETITWDEHYYGL